MPSKSSENHFDENYYATSCGRPYQRDEHWLKFFDNISENLLQRMQFSSVLDAGCAWGFLVESLRKRGVDAWGVDISEFAISNVHESAKPYCWVGSVADPFPQKYDLIVSIEVLEHMKTEDAQNAIINFCKFSDDILFSSSPFDYKETTHFNVQPPEVWAELFAFQGFYRDTDFDASFLTPWAVRFRKRDEPTSRIVREYERRFWTVWKENTDLRELNLEIENKISVRDTRIENLKLESDRLRGKVQTLSQKLEDNRKRLQHLLGYKKQYDRIMLSRSWRLMLQLHQIRHRFIPLGSKREKVFQSFLGFSGTMLRKVNRNRVLQTGDSAIQRIGQRSYTYSDWINDFEPNAQTLEAQISNFERLAYKPLISIVTPVYNPPKDVLRKTILSVVNQTYLNWELCLADASDVESTQDLIEEFSAQDKRIKYRKLKENLGISGNSNQALETATGEFVALVDHDDLLAPNMLYELVCALNEEPDLDILYFDEDKVDKSGKNRIQPFLKPDWSPEMFLSVNYLTHPVIRRSLINEVGNLNPQKDGSQDWDLLFRCTEKTNRIKHIPKILYHWRQVPGSTSGAYRAKSYVFDHQILSVEEHLQRIGVENPTAAFVRPGYLRTTWPVRGEKVSIIIPTKDNATILQKCLNSILQITEYPDFEVILVDNKSSEPEVLSYYQKIQDDSRIKILPYDEVFNFNTALNLGAKNASGRFLLFLNNDIEILEGDWLSELVQWAELPEIGVVGAKLIYPDEKIQHAGVVVGMQGHASHPFWGMREWQGTIFGSTDWYRNYLAVTGACMMIPRNVFDEIGGFDEDYELVFSDIEICVRIYERGYRILYTPYARLIHHEGKSRGEFMPTKDIQRGAEQLREIIENGDPYFNANLSYNSRIPRLKQPGEENRIDRLERLVARWTEKDRNRGEE